MDPDPGVYYSRIVLRGEDMGTFSLSRIWCAIILIAAFSTSSAVAQLSAYNDAARKGDLKTAAAEAAKVWPGYDKQKPSATILAREFAWSAMMGDRREDA